MRRLTALSIVAVAVAACGGAEQGSDSTAPVSTAVQTTPPAVVESTSVSSQAVAGSSDSTTTSSTQTTTAGTSTSTSTTTSTPSTTSTTTLPAAVVEACRSLEEDALDTRTLTWEQSTDQAAVTALCPVAVEYLDDALVIVERQRTMDIDVDRFSASIDCLDNLGRVSFLVEHDYDFDVGTVFLPTVEFVGPDGSTIERSSLAPAIGLALAPGAERRTTAIVPAADQYEQCGFTAPTFVADDAALTGDGARPIDRDLPRQELADVDVWFVDLVAAERAYRSPGGGERFDNFGDLHGIGWVNSFPSTPTALGELADDVNATFEVCDVSLVEGSDRHAVVTFRFDGQVIDDDTEVESTEVGVFAGLLRRGSDGRWRWLAGVDRLDDSMPTCDLWRRAETAAP